MHDQCTTGRPGRKDGLLRYDRGDRRVRHLLSALLWASTSQDGRHGGCPKPMPSKHAKLGLLARRAPTPAISPLDPIDSGPTVAPCGSALRRHCGKRRFLGRISDDDSRHDPSSARRGIQGAEGCPRLRILRPRLLVGHLVRGAGVHRAHLHHRREHSDRRQGAQGPHQSLGRHRLPGRHVLHPDPDTAEGARPLRHHPPDGYRHHRAGRAHHHRLDPDLRSDHPDQGAHEPRLLRRRVRDLASPSGSTPPSFTRA